MKYVVCSVMLLGVFGVSLQAQTLAKTAGDFAKVCEDVEAKAATRNPTLALNNGYCLGYLQGVLLSNYLFNRLKRGDPFFCAPLDVTPGEARKVFLKYINEHPEKLHEEPNFTVLQSLTAVFPCKS